MYNLIISAFGKLLTFIFARNALRFVLFSALFVFIVEAIDWIKEYSSTCNCGVGDSIWGAFDIASGIPGFGWIWQMLDVGTGLSIIVSAHAIRFVIRRIPIIG